ncbi:hypothetical protein F4680DRAFT_427173 [Xylaria scruposa]|nr:hypothetical protein F4680DRAFT_427173 [Xylaria scruposa]
MTLIEILKNVQKEKCISLRMTHLGLYTSHLMTSGYLRLNSNDRIPVTSAELIHFVNPVDKDHTFSFADEQENSEMLQWLFFWHGSATPYLGQFCSLQQVRH